MILLDTSALIDCLAGPRRSEHLLIGALEQGERVGFSVLVLYEWFCGPRSPEQLAAQEFFLPSDRALRYELEDARLSAQIYRSVKRARTREIDIAIAATAIRHEARLWTLNPKDFADIPGLSLWRSR